MAKDNNTIHNEFLTYNIAGLKPVSSVFIIDIDTFEKKMKEMISNEIDGVIQVSHERDRETGEVRMYAWFNGNSDHFIDRSHEDSAIQTKLVRHSPQLKKFCEKFGWRKSDDERGASGEVNMKKIIVSNIDPEVGRKMVAVRLAINPFIFAMFDMYGTQFKKDGNENLPKCGITRDWVWDKSPKGQYRNLMGIRVEKYVESIFQNRGAKPRANKSANFQ